MARRRTEVRRRRVETDRAVFLGDWHVPFHDHVATELVLDFLSWYKPDAVFLVGDVVDFYSVSSYDKDPQRLLSLQDDLNQAVALLARLRKVARKARIIYLDGNHENRLVRYLNNHPEISVLDSLKLPELLKLGDVGAEHHGYQSQLRWHGLLVEHGDRVRGKSAYTAAAMLESRGVCGLSGHTHRLGVYYRTDNTGVKVWAENGCLCDLKPSYLIGVPNWMQGFTVGYGLRGRQRFALEQVPIIDRKLYFHGEMWC